MQTLPLIGSGIVRLTVDGLLQPQFGQCCGSLLGIKTITIDQQPATVVDLFTTFGDIQPHYLQGSVTGRAELASGENVTPALGHIVAGTDTDGFYPGATAQEQSNEWQQPARRGGKHKRQHGYGIRQQVKEANRTKAPFCRP